MKNLLYASAARRRPPIFPVKATVWDGTNDYLTKANPWGADTKVFIFSMWILKTGGDGVLQYIQGDRDGLFYLKLEADNTFSVYGGLSGVGDSIAMNSTGTITVDATWHHIAASVDLATSTEQIYLDGVSDVNVTTSNNRAIDMNNATTCGMMNAWNGAGPVNAEVSEYYFNQSEHLDLSVLSNLRKLRNSDGKPTDLGADGSLVTGSQPEYYHSVRPGDAASMFYSNKGFLGDFALTGAITIAATSPSD